MQTRCPACRKLFVLPVEQVVLSRGEVRCGECKATFNSIDNLIGRDGKQVQRPTLTNIAIDGDDSSATKGTLFIPIDEAAIASLLHAEQSDTNSDTEVTPLQLTPIAQKTKFTLIHAEEESVDANNAMIDNAMLPNTIAGQDSTALVNAIKQHNYQLPRRRDFHSSSVMLRVGQIALILLLSLSLAGQYLYLQRDHFGQLETTRTILELICDVAPCTIPLRYAPEQFVISDRRMQMHPDFDNVLLITALLHNNAPFPQEYPVIKLVLTDMQQQVTAERRFYPHQYFTTPPDEPMPGNSVVDILLQIIDKESMDTGYQLLIAR